MELLTVKNLSFSYPETPKTALSQVSFTLREGDFSVLCGATGSGKSTLLRLLKRELSPNGSESGDLLLRGKDLRRISSERIGFVMQRPDEQLVTDKVSSELAFGPENLGLPQPLIAKRVAEMASYFGIEDWFDRDVSTLSGGEKQLLNLASVMIMNPDLLILDEPTSQLDPIATSDFLHTLKKLNRDFSLTILLAEHRLEEVIPLCDQLLVMDRGTILQDGNPREIVASLQPEDPLLPAMPTASRLFHKMNGKGECPLTVREGRNWLAALPIPTNLPKDTNAPIFKNKALEFKNVYFRYEKNSPDVLSNLSFTVWENEIFCLLGGNGSGKSTALSCAAGVRRPYSGTIRVFDRKIKDYVGQSLYRNCLTLLPQDVQTVFLCNTVQEELEEVKADPRALPFDLSPLYAKHPYDLSGGEQQLVALAKVLAGKPKLLLMDEPTKGLDAIKKKELLHVIRRLKAEGMTLLIVTHDVEFAALCADRCALFFRGNIASRGTPEEFFWENSFYTTAAARLAKGYAEKAVTVEEIARRYAKERKQ